MESGKTQEQFSKWGEAMDRSSHEQTYGKFLTLLKWGIIICAITLSVVAWVMTN